MEFFDVIKSRHSIRKFKLKEIEKNKIKKILETANAAPSAGDFQSYEMVLVKNKYTKEKLATAAYDQECISEAPAVLVFLANPNKSLLRYGTRGKELYCIQDATIAASYAQLAATNLGLGSVWIGAFDEKKVKKIINSKNLKPVCIMPIGYPNEKPYITPRKKISDLVHEENL